MKNRILIISTLLVSLIYVMSSCQQVEDLTPSVSRFGINSITASFPGDDSSDNNFTSEIDYDNKVIKIVFPYNYPLTSDKVLTMADLTKVRVKANLDDNVSLSPALLYMDLSKENYITITDQSKNKSDYKVVAEIRKSAAAVITSFDIRDLGLSGVIDEDKKTISIISIDPIGEAFANVSISHGATLDPDPRIAKVDFDNDVEISVIAQDGVTKNVYTVRKAVPEKVEFGIRAGSAKVLWAKKLQADLGVTALNITGGIAVTDDYVVVNTRGEASIYLDKKTGANIGKMPNMGSVLGNLTNFYSTSDDNNNILVCNLAPGAGTFKIWKFKGVDANPEVFIDWSNSGAKAVGRKVSVKGSIDGNAIITAALMGGDMQFARWVVVDGTLVSHTPEIITINGIGGAWTNNADVVHSSSTDLSADYFVSYYAAPRKVAWVDGKTNSVKAWGPEINSNWIQNAVDHAVFNNCQYVVSNSINSFTWGSDDSIYLFDASGTSTFTEPIWKAPIGTYGGKDNGGTNANGTGDVALKVSKDGYYMHLYFMFTNGQVVCVQYDCIKM